MDDGIFAIDRDQIRQCREERCVRHLLRLDPCIHAFIPRGEDQIERLQRRIFRINVLEALHALTVLPSTLTHPCWPDGPHTMSPSTTFRDRSELPLFTVNRE